MKSAGTTATIGASRSRPVRHRDLGQARIRQFAAIERELDRTLDHFQAITAVLTE